MLYIIVYVYTVHINMKVHWLTYFQSIREEGNKTFVKKCVELDSLKRLYKRYWAFSFVSLSEIQFILDGGVSRNRVEWRVQIQDFLG